MRRLISYTIDVLYDSFDSHKLWFEYIFTLYRPLKWRGPIYIRLVLKAKYSADITYRYVYKLIWLATEHWIRVKSAYDFKNYGT
jgi:hypothetical protein